jgi:hypothetical protein
MSYPEAKSQLMRQLFDRYANDPEFQQQMRREPVGTAERFMVERSGMKLDEGDRQALNSMDWSLPDEQLSGRASKGLWSN